MIPKIIHYCWLSNDSVPENLQSCMRSWKEKLSDYEFVLWNFDRFDINSSLWVKQAFENKKYAFAADYIRLYAVYNYGGIYLDMDVEVLKEFDDLLSRHLILAYEDENKAGIEAGCFGAEKKNPIIKSCLDYYANRSFVKADGTFDTLPLPMIMAKYCCNAPDVKIENRFYFTCKSYTTGIVTIKPYSYTIHHFAGSWLTDEAKDRAKITQKCCSVFGKRLGLIITAVFFSLKYRGIKGSFNKLIEKIKDRF